MEDTMITSVLNIDATVRPLTRTPWLLALDDQQLPDGSWEGNTILTSLNLVQLLGQNRDPADTTLERAANWLVNSPEPAGLPGLYLFSPAYAARFNTWKTAPFTEGRHYWLSLPVELQRFSDQHSRELARATRGLSDDFPRRWKACELRLSVPTALALEALLRTGYIEHPRLKRAIHTLFALARTPSCGAQWRCGCTYLDARLYMPEYPGEPDFRDLPKLPAVPADCATLFHRALTHHPAYPHAV